MIDVCNGCTEETGRSATCHGSCEKYLQARKEHEEQRQEYIKKRNDYEDYKNYVHSSKAKVINKAHLKSRKGRTRYGQA